MNDDREWYLEGTCEHGKHLTEWCARCEQAHYDALECLSDEELTDDTR